MVEVVQWSKLSAHSLVPWLVDQASQNGIQYNVYAHMKLTPDWDETVNDAVCLECVVIHFHFHVSKVLELATCFVLYSGVSAIKGTRPKLTNIMSILGTRKFRPACLYQHQSTFFHSG